MQFRAVKSPLAAIQPLRAMFLQENPVQIRYDACHGRGWSDAYLLTVNNLQVGYGSIKGRDELTDRDTVFEYYVLPSFRKFANQLYGALLEASGAAFAESQSNVLLQTSMLFEFARQIQAEAILFLDNTATALCCPGSIFRPRKEGDDIFPHTTEPTGDYVLETGAGIVATGGYLTHYNLPFADLYMEVREDQRRKGFGSYLLQEIKKECYLSGRVPAARCNIGNKASKAALLKAGFAVSGYVLAGEIQQDRSK